MNLRTLPAHDARIPAVLGDNVSCTVYVRAIHGEPTIVGVEVAGVILDPDRAASRDVLAELDGFDIDATMARLERLVREYDFDAADLSHGSWWTPCTMAGAL